jgi:hypothetical protein
VGDRGHGSGVLGGSLSDPHDLDGPVNVDARVVVEYENTVADCPIHRGTDVPAEATGTRLIFGPGVGDDFYAYDLDRRHGHPVTLPAAFDYRGYQPSAFYGRFTSENGQVVFVVGPNNGGAPARAYVTRADLSGSPRLLASDVRGLVAGYQPGAMWIGSPAASGQQAWQEYDVASGRTISAPVKLSADLRVVGETTAGLVTTQGDLTDRIEVHHRHTGALLITVADHAGGTARSACPGTWSPGKRPRIASCVTCKSPCTSRTPRRRSTIRSRRGSTATAWTARSPPTANSSPGR